MPDPAACMIMHEFESQRCPITRVCLAGVMRPARDDATEAECSATSRKKASARRRKAHACDENLRLFEGNSELASIGWLERKQEVGRIGDLVVTSLLVVIASL